MHWIPRCKAIIIRKEIECGSTVQLTRMFTPVFRMGLHERSEVRRFLSTALLSQVMLCQQLLQPRLFARLRVVHRGTQSNITGTCEVSLHRSFPALLWIAPNILRYIGDPKKNVLQSGVTRSIALKTGHLVNFCTVLYLRICKRTYRIWRIASSAETSEQSQIQHHTSHSKIKMPQSGEPPFRHHPLCTQAEI